MRFGRQRLDLVTMSGRELQCIEVLSEVLARRPTEISAVSPLKATVMPLLTRFLVSCAHWSNWFLSKYFAVGTGQSLA
jgi:hypothetical protein